MPPDAPVLTSLGDALVRFAFPDSSVQTSRHILALHWYVACRLVVEGGFDPDRIRPRHRGTDPVGHLPSPRPRRG